MATYPLPARVTRWWSGKPDSERRVAVVLALVTVTTIAWLAAWQPLTRDIAAMQLAQPPARAALADAQKMVDEIAGLARSPALPVAGDPGLEIERVLTAAGLRNMVTQMDSSDGRTRIALGAVDFDRLLAALETLQRESHLRVIEGTITARVEPGMVRAELTLGR